jgi:hypothetical protein
VLAAADAAPVRIALDDPERRTQLAAALAAGGSRSSATISNVMPCISAPQRSSSVHRAFDVMIAAALAEPAAGTTLEALAGDLLGVRPPPFRDLASGAAAG